MRSKASVSFDISLTVRSTIRRRPAAIICASCCISRSCVCINRCDSSFCCCIISIICSLYRFYTDLCRLRGGLTSFTALDASSPYTCSIMASSVSLETPCSNCSMILSISIVFVPEESSFMASACLRNFSNFNFSNWPRSIFL